MFFNFFMNLLRYHSVRLALIKIKQKAISRLQFSDILKGTEIINAIYFPRNLVRKMLKFDITLNDMKSVTVIKDENLKNSLQSNRCALGNMTKICMFLAQLPTVIKCTIFKSLYVLDAFF